MGEICDMVLRQCPESSKEGAADIAVGAEPEHLDGLSISRKNGERRSGSHRSWKSNPNLFMPLSAVDAIIPPGIADIAVRANPKDIFSLWGPGDNNEGRVCSN